MFPQKYWPPESDGGHLRFALKHQRVDLTILKSYFLHAGDTAVVELLGATPNGAAARRLWFFYEWLTGERIDRPDLTQGNYVDAIDAACHFTAPVRRSRRHRINDNLLGTPTFCPMVWRTGPIKEFVQRRLDRTCRRIMQKHDQPLIARAVSYLYRKETKSSFAIEDELPSASRIDRFVAALRRASENDLCQKSKLVGLQKTILDPRFAGADWRTNQVYVGQTVNWEEEVHHVCPRPEDLTELMSGWESLHRRLVEASDPSDPGGRSALPALVRAATLSYGFVFLHPFDDGNGRTHRLLIHNQLAVSGFVPDGLIIPVSATMLAKPSLYDASLESTSAPLLDCIDYQMDERGEMTVGQSTIDLYRYPNFTLATEALATFLTTAVEENLRSQIAFLQRFDAAASAIQSIVDLPDRLLAKMVQFTLQNGGQLAKSKRRRYFDALTDDEVRRIETAVGGVIQRHGPG